MPRFGALALALLLTAPVLPAVLPVPAMAQAAARDPAAEAFVQTQATEALRILSSGQPLAAKRQAFRALVDQIADVPRITGFVLGKYNRTATPAQRAEFAPLFRSYVNNVYETRLGQYKGETLKVTGSVARAPGDVVVSTTVGGGQLKTPAKVNWRLLKSPDGRWRAVDVQVEGVWLAITQQQDFVSTIDNASGNVGVLIAQLKKQVAAQEAPAR